jgi:hypothetical protein
MAVLPVLDVAIGVAFVYLLIALMCTTLNEVIAGLLDKRAKMLYQGIERLLGDKSLTDRLYQQPHIESLTPARTRWGTPRPSYIPGSRFAQALKALQKTETLPDKLAIQLKEVEELPPVATPAAGSSAPVEEWYEQTMDRVNGWYKRYVQKQTYLLAAILVLMLNVDSTYMVQRFWNDSALRATAVEQAKVRIQNTGGESVPLMEYTEGDKPEGGRPIQTGNVTLTDAEKEMLADITGWKADLSNLRARRSLDGDKASTYAAWMGNMIAQHGLGWLMSILAISLGAPFWFDTLNRFMNVRNAGRAPDERRSKAAPEEKKP